ncbi:MAG: DMT family transporter [Sedimentisphaerales bacterium]
MWIYLGIFSAIFLGMYDVSRKHALRQNAVLPVLFFATVFGALFVLPIILLSRFRPELLPSSNFYLPTISAIAHLRIFAKAVIVSAAWALSYSALKNLPISIASPFGATGLIWTLIGAVLLFHEQPTVLQYLGLGLMVISYYGFSVLGSKEGIIFYNNKWMTFIFLSTLLGSASAMYDKFLIQTAGYSPVAVQVWFSIYLPPVLGAVVLVSRLAGEKNILNPPFADKFVWRWSIPAIGGFLLVADFLYFKAISCHGSLIATISTLRASCIAVSFIVGGLLFRELRLSSKAMALAGTLAGIGLILLSKP